MSIWGLLQLIGLVALLIAPAMMIWLVLRRKKRSWKPGVENTGLPDRKDWPDQHHHP
ncbi:MAG: hypothetical protein AAGE80_09880 [Pseudomonadota bacterium]